MQRSRRQVNEEYSEAELTEHVASTRRVIPSIPILDILHRMNTNDTFMRESIKEAKKAKLAGDLPFGAVIVSNGKIVGRGKCENGTVGDVTDHAELIALREACRTLGRNELKDCVIFCTNEPCPMCASGIFQAKIPHVVVGLTREDLPNLLRPRNILMKNLAEDSGYEIQIETGVMKDTILELFNDIVKK